MVVTQPGGTTLGPSYGLSEGNVTLLETYPVSGDGTRTERLWVTRNLRTGRVAPQVEIYFDSTPPCTGRGSFIREDFTEGWLVAGGDTAYRVEAERDEEFLPAAVLRTSGTCEPYSGTEPFPVNRVRGFYNHVESGGTTQKLYPLAIPAPLTLTSSAP
ncbi:hypothetical protein FJV41_23900 [Myxococcus llanfairpwllgwyngyllgogerychwyrndrobwllllantysiliogogogochensis]|uniref:Uncharacterized protein n=1 Tax=Myxococcus llanfairpwllgwyngyllgogerychwyrndrobwllllantysiliogogogochensis TaxID=2590453 RepID=A0A540WWR3_9BACT|nr:hypothetical protein [Myxococcus llanfairpwllgwyngyllgogerychwyrndrobwllllantysiliogogogochensis]TQF13436.1 hypothetical protein FJV41_23900 [Myxococcus llanfairpwllgwyngyllgogerychwyrndrobwllllantysiliogogogochensis]